MKFDIDESEEAKGDSFIGELGSPTAPEIFMDLWLIDAIFDPVKVCWKCSDVEFMD